MNQGLRILGLTSTGQDVLPINPQEDEQMSMDMLRSAVLADFLRTRRQRLQPDQVGLAPRARARRTAGLRREELAELVGISPDWYARLEQGKAIRVSSHVLDRLATVLQLTQAEREYLFALAENPPRGFDCCPSWVPVSDAVAALVQAQGALPAYVTGPRFQFLTWNQAAIDVFGDFARSPEPERNVLWFMFTGDVQRRLVDWPMHARRLIAAFRVYTCRCAGEPWMAELVTRLQRHSTEFAAWWADHDVGRTAEAVLELHHPLVGHLVIRGSMMSVNGRPDLRLAMYTPEPDTETEGRLRALADRHARLAPTSGVNSSASDAASQGGAQPVQEIPAG